MAKNPNDDGSQSFAKDLGGFFESSRSSSTDFETMTNLGPSVSIFGSARIQSDSPYYQMAIAVAQHLAQRRFANTTGGGPGLMEAANRGAQSMNGPSCGLAN